ncbi:unnamed protein product [Ranitomeya imitator]|uniref:Ig-like domain-containing protein n=1 Tax=Ranitomeya imitator TaxID=111125 RepID=A0ABN9MB96_9NEOB|nr:unnamed protein product [Ranitomeya imitator]
MDVNRMERIQVSTGSDTRIRQKTGSEQPSEHSSQVVLLRDMALYVFCIFLLYVSDCPVRSAEVLNQKETEIAQPGKSVQLQCEVSGYNINNHHLHWMRQSPGSIRIEWIAAFRTGHATYIDESFKDRVTPSTSGSTGLLKIDRLVKSDTAVYYCARDTMRKFCCSTVKISHNDNQALCGL